MPTGKSAMRQAAATGGTPPRQESFPPLSISHPALLKDGSDRQFRQLILRLLRLSTLMIRNREHFAAYIGVTDPQYTMIILIADNPGITIGGIAEQMSVTSQFVTTESAKLMAKGIVEKRPSEADRRSVLLTLTPKGRKLLMELGPLRRRINDRTFASLTAERARFLDETLTALVADTRSALHELEAPEMSAQRAPSAVDEPQEAGGTTPQKVRRGRTAKTAKAVRA